MCEDCDDEFIDEHSVNGKDRLGVPNEGERANKNSLQTFLKDILIQSFTLGQI